jgi:RimJ/RimL family protein N-acetyltransferase
MELDITKAQPDDHLILGEMNQQLIEDEGHANPMTMPQLQDRMRGWLEADYIAYMIRQNGEIVGYCLYRDYGGLIYIRHLFIARDHRCEGYYPLAARECLEWPAITHGCIMRE